MKNRDLVEEQFSDVKNVLDHTFYPGQYVSYDIALYNPGGLPL